MMKEEIFSDSCSALILALHRGKENCPATVFKAWIFEQLGNVLDFDTASWLSSAGVDDEYILDHYKPDPPVLNDKTPRLCVSVEDKLTTLSDRITLYRLAGKRAFTTKDQILLEWLLPHMRTSYRQNLIYAMQLPQYNLATGFGAYAICNGAGVLHRASAAFTDLLLLEVPEWQGPILPWKAIKTSGRRRYFEIKGNRVIVNVRRSEKLFHLHIRPRIPIDDLSVAELKVARALANGSSYKTAAQHLKLSPSTINNHAANIYRKLGVHNKAALVGLWQELEESRKRC